MKKLILLILSSCLTVQLVGQGKIQMRTGLSYIFAFYNGYTPNYSNYIESPKSINGPGLFIKGEYYINSALSIQSGLEIINTNISFNEVYIASGFVNEKYRHNLNLMELQIPINLKFSTDTNKILSWYCYGGLALRLLPYAFGTIKYPTGGQINSGQLDVRIFENPLAPNGGVGVDFQKDNKRIGFFGEVSYKYLISNYLYGGHKEHEWVNDNLIENRHFIIITTGLKI